MMICDDTIANSMLVFSLKKASTALCFMSTLYIRSYFVLKGEDTS